MARYKVVQFLALSCILSFNHVSRSLKRYSLTEQPHLSTCVVLFLAGCICFAASRKSKWIAFGDGRFTAGTHRPCDGPLSGAAEDEALLNGSTSHVPNRPRRFSLPALILCVVLRLELFHLVNYQQQCSSPGIEAFLCLVLIGYEIFSSRRRWGVPPTDDAEDPWRSVFDDLYDWFTGPRVTMVVMLTSACLFSLGTYLSISQITRSTYICFAPADSQSWTLTLQLLELVLDATIVILFWRILAWARTVRLRLRVLASVFVISSLVSSALWLGGIVFRGARQHDAGFGSLHGFDFLVDSVALAIFTSSALFWICETSPITPVSVITFFVGTWSSILNVLRLGDWMHLSIAECLSPIWLIAFGTVLFLYTHDVRSVAFCERPFLTFLLMLILCVATIVSFLKRDEMSGERHPINDLMYQAQTEHHRWLLKAGTSQSLPVAVKVYEESHAGRMPPPNFSEWYQYASASLVIDEFQQIDQDLAPFAGIAPADLRKRADAMASDSSASVITIKNGQVNRRDAVDGEGSADLDELVEMIQKFSRYLPDMVLPINLGPTPRILPSWKDVQLQSRADMGFIAHFISKRRREAPDVTTSSLEAKDGQTNSGLKDGPSVRAGDFRQMLLKACSPAARARSSPDWSVGQFCTECASSHSRAQLMTSFQRSLDSCEQPDLQHLHGFFLSDQRLSPIRQLVPLFSASKTDGFRDIMIPIPRSRLEKPDIPWQFSRRYDNLFWRGTVGNNSISNQALRGGHKFRLLHLLNRPHEHDKVTMVFPAPGQEDQFGAEKVLVAEANRAMPISAGMVDYSACEGENCEAVKQVFGTEADTEEALEYRYVLLTDEDDGPPGELIRTIRSGSVPFISTIFRTWYTERLVPWLHFVPVDVRYQALHTAFSYFTGTEKRPKINGRETGLQGRHFDGEWIGRRGQKWAEQALSKRDMEIYLFRLLLEWGRLIDDRRGEIGYRRMQDGSFQNDGWAHNE